MPRLLLCAALLLIPIGAFAQTPAAAAEKEVRAFIATYNAAYGRNDLDAYFRSFAPDLTQWFPSGLVDLPSYQRGGSTSARATVSTAWRCGTCRYRSGPRRTRRGPPTSCA